MASPENSNKSGIHRLVPHHEDVPLWMYEQGFPLAQIMLVSPDSRWMLELVSLEADHEAKGTRIIRGNIVDTTDETGVMTPVFIKATPAQGSVEHVISTWWLATREKETQERLYAHDPEHFLKPQMLIRAMLPSGTIFHPDTSDTPWHEHVLLAREWRDHTTTHLLSELIVEGYGLLKDPANYASPLDISRIQEIIPHWAQAIQSAHACNIWNLDVKPGNTMIEDLKQLARDTGTFKAVDLASSIPYLPLRVILFDVDSVNTIWPIRRGHKFLFTPEYAAPETLRHDHELMGFEFPGCTVSEEPATKASDSYALGVSVYEMLTGDIPYPPEVDLTVTDAVNKILGRYSHIFSVIDMIKHRNEICRAYVPRMYGVPHFPSIYGNPRLEAMGVRTDIAQQAFEMVLTEPEKRHTPGEFAEVFCASLKPRKLWRIRNAGPRPEAHD